MRNEYKGLASWGNSPWFAQAMEGMDMRQIEVPAGLLRAWLGINDDDPAFDGLSKGE